MRKVSQEQGLYRPEFEHDACGTGFTAHIKGRKSHQIIRDALTMLENMEHRGACGSERTTGDGAGILIQMPHEFLYAECLKLGIKLPESGKYGVGMVFFRKSPAGAKNVAKSSSVARKNWVWISWVTAKFPYVRTASVKQRFL